AKDPLVRVVGREDQYAGARTDPEQAADRLDAAHARQLEVEQDDLGPVAADQRQPLLGRPGRAADREVGLVLERGDPPLPHDREAGTARDPDPVPPLGGRAPRAARAAPRRGRLATRSRPPSSLPRPRMPPRPCRPSAARRSSKPTPSSRTESVTPRGVARRPT